MRRDWEVEHPDFPGQVAHPASLVGEAAVAIALGAQREEVVRLELDRSASHEQM